MSSLKRISLASLALGLLGDPVIAEEIQPMELDAINVSADYESPTGPVTRYGATRSASATKTDTAPRDIPQ